MKKKLGILPLGRPTFDVPYAVEKLAAMLEALERAGHQLTGPRELLFDADATRTALEAVMADNPDLIILLQVTFTDASMAVEIASSFSGPIGIWAIPEPRVGGRLRLNSFCGLNLASHALGLNGRAFSWCYRDPDADDITAELEMMITANRPRSGLVPSKTGQAADADAAAIAKSIAGSRIGRIGEHPAGFDTCRYDKTRLKKLAGVEVDELTLETLFDLARVQDKPAVDSTRVAAQSVATGLELVDQEQLDRSLRLKPALDALTERGRYSAFAIRCWPETFTEYGGAVCGPVAMMGENRIPCACEADVYGALTQMILQKTADAPVFLTDLVDLEREDNTGVIWHCGQAPASMADQASHPGATIHTNRKMPLLFEFTLKPGRMTFMRISQAKGVEHMVIAGGEMLSRPMSFTGTSGVVRFDTQAGELTGKVMECGLEHHMAVAYGDHREKLRGVAAALSIPVLEL
ncbi:MAG: hypothetical protein R3D32_04950 [Nitratireductor sp.]